MIYDISTYTYVDGSGVTQILYPWNTDLLTDFGYASPFTVGTGHAMMNQLQTFYIYKSNVFSYSLNLPSLCNTIDVGGGNATNIYTPNYLHKTYLNGPSVAGLTIQSDSGSG